MTPPQGRFVSPDPLGMMVANPADPQQWNLYAYVRNNPLAYVDPTGLDPEPTGDARGITIPIRWIVPRAEAGIPA
jgi:uncharacterized protein RhaS with RHS repeats